MMSDMHTQIHGQVPKDVVNRMRQSLTIVIGWQEAELPSRFAIGGGELRMLTTRIREQPVNFMIIVYQSLRTATDGEGLCKRGSKASRVLLGEENSSHDERNKAQFTTRTIEEIKKSASDLNQYTHGMQSKFRSLRIALLNIHNDLRKYTTKRERSTILARLSRHLSKGVRNCEDALRKVNKDLDEIEKSLNLITCWWQRIESEANYLQMNGESSLAREGNTITLKELQDCFTKLEEYFVTYRLKMSELYDDNLAILNAVNLEHLEDMKSRFDLVFSGNGQLVPAQR